MKGGRVCALGISRHLRCRSTSGERVRSQFETIGLTRTQQSLTLCHKQDSDWPAPWHAQFYAAHITGWWWDMTAERWMKTEGLKLIRDSWTRAGTGMNQFRVSSEDLRRLPPRPPALPAASPKRRFVRLRRKTSDGSQQWVWMTVRRTLFWLWVRISSIWVEMAVQSKCPFVAFSFYHVSHMLLINELRNPSLPLLFWRYLRMIEGRCSRERNSRKAQLKSCIFCP